MRLLRLAVSFGLLATLTLAVSQPTPAAPAAGGKTYAVDTVHSSVIFRIKHFGIANFYGRFNDITGQIVYDAANAARSSVNLTIKTESVDTKAKQRDDHLRSPDFFNAAAFPEIAFKSTRVRALGGDAYEVTGNLTIHGVTKPITARVQHTGTATQQNRERIGFETILALKRSDFEMNYMIGRGLDDDLQLTLSVEAVGQ